MLGGKLQELSNNLCNKRESQRRKKEGIIAIKQWRLSVGFSFIKTKI